jgi:predicted PurR-regulated permease PerM
LYLARDIFIPLAFAIVLAMVLAPAVGLLQKLRLRRLPAVLVVMLVAILAGSGISYVLFDQLVQIVNELPSYRVNIDHKLDALTAPTNSAFGRAEQSVMEIGKKLTTAGKLPPPPMARRQPAPGSTPANPMPVQIIDPPANSLIYLRDLIQPFFMPLAILGIVLVFTVFLMAEQTDLRNRLFRLAGVSRLNVVTRTLEDATQRVSRYLMLQFLVNAGFGLVCGAGLFWIGVPYAALWGSLAAMLRIVPYVGSVAAGLLPLVLSLAVFDGWLQPCLVLLLFGTLELVTGNFFEPWLYGVHTGISSLALLLTTVFWTALWGPAGLILSTPLTVCVVVLGRHVPHLGFLHILLGDQPVLEPGAQLYQRLLAMDDQEARAVAEEYRRANSALQLFDGVLLPALTMAELDRHKGALDPEREEFLFLSMREILTEFAENPAEGEPAVARAGRVLCFPAHDEADEIAAAMLAQLLEQTGRAVITFPLGASPQSMADMVAASAEDVFCISSVPPFAFAHARTIARQLRAKAPQTPILIGVWGFSGEIEPALQRFQPALPAKLVNSLAGALEFLNQTTPR